MFQFSPISERIRDIRAKRDVFTTGKDMSINAERTLIYTNYYKTHENEFPILKRAGALKTWCLEKEANIFDDDIFVGSLGPKERMLSPYVDISVNWIPGVVNDTDENFKAAWQSGSVYMSDAHREIFRDAYDYWKERNLSRMVRGALTDDYLDASGNGCYIEGLGPQGFDSVSGMPQGHYIANFNKVVNTGYGKMREEYLAKISDMSGKTFGKTAKQQTFYHAMVRICDGAITLSKRYAAATREKAAAATGERKAELLKMADSLDWIMENPARTYWEGLQAILFYQLLLSTDAQQHGQSMGRVDKYVGHLLEKELADGKITTEEAQLLTDAFIMKLCDYIHLPGFASFLLNNKRIVQLINEGQNLFTGIYNGLTATAGIAITLGGQKPDGSDDSTPATILFLQTYGRMCLPDPTVALRINKNTPDEVWRVGIEASKISGGMPEFQNDDVIIPALMSTGMSHEDACNYSIVGCVEPAGTGCEWPACGTSGAESIWNMADLIPIIINGGVNPRTGVTCVPAKKLYEFESFEEVLESFDKQIQHILGWNVSYCNVFEMVYSHYFPCVVASSMMEGCLDSGLDVTEGGSKYNRTGMTACGTANVADSLMAIKKLCFDEKSVSLQEMYDALAANWEGFEDLRQRVINDVPHYGNDNDEVDALASWALGRFTDILAELDGPRGKYSGGTFTMTAHIRFGFALGATPDGRKAHEPIADAISSRQGFDINGPTAYLTSAAKLPHLRLTNGDQLNIRFSPTAVAGDAGAMKLRQLIEAYFMLGGMQVQFNVVSTEILHKAQDKPDEFKNLVVRIAGFSTYFVTLDPNTQNDFISRTEQQL